MNSKKKLINFPKLIRNLWICLWIVLIILLVFKLLFHKWYPIVIENNFLINISNFMDTKFYRHFIFATIFYIFSNYFVTLASTRNKYFKLIYLIPLIIISILNNILKYYNNTLGMLVEIIILIIFPIVYNIIHKTFKRMLWNILFPIIINIITMVWQLNILFIRDINDLLKDMPFIISFTLQLDYYIFLIITWIGAVYIMSIWGSWFFEEQLNYFKGLKEKELTKDNPDSVALEDIDRQIKYYEDKIKEAKA